MLENKCSTIQKFGHTYPSEGLFVQLNTFKNNFKYIKFIK